MSDFIYRLAVTVPTVMVVFALVWYVAKLFGAVGSGAAFSTRHLRTRPLMLVLLVAAVFALVSASIVAALGESMWSSVIASAVAALVAVGVVPRLWAHFAR